ncbi:IclR family transcriptional regulator [Pseudactinotalea sp. Z1748]|uniref:IclR family transcriptional regulator n=1 Tax=Pseudactinotalea sp. Z1748 TaxID=3413027 RepID=UPI003C7A59FE
MEPRSTSYHSQGLTRALRVLRTLGAHDEPIALAQLSRQLELPKSTLVRLLSVLEAEGFVRKATDAPTFEFGDALIEIANNAIHRVDAGTVAAPHLRHLAEATGYTSNVGVLAGEAVLHLRVEEPQRALRFRSSSGSIDHLHCTGLGKMLLATLPHDARAEYLPPAPYPTFTPRTLTTLPQLEKEFDRIRTNRYSVDDEERDSGVICLAVPVPNDQQAVCAVSIAGPAGELTPAHRLDVLQALTETAAALGSESRFLSALRAFRDAYPIPHEGTS